MFAKLKKLKEKKKEHALILLMIVTVILRLVNLGYSDYQGDEIKAFFLPEEGQSASEFLLDQRKGPTQFLVTYIVSLINPSYDNQFLVRLPFTLAGILSVYFFYRLIEIYFGRRIAFFSGFFLATNGFFIAFSRIAQYQSFVILFDILALYWLTLAVRSKTWQVKGIYLGLIGWAISILSHYDGIFIAPFAFWLLYQWFRDVHLDNATKTRSFVVAGAIATVMLLAFYIPFILSISDATRSYWSGRVSGDVSSKISSSRYLFTVYQPIYVIHIYTILFLLGVTSPVVFLLSRSLQKKHKMTKLLRKIIDWYENSYKDIFTKEKLFDLGMVFVWFLVPLIFFEKIVYISGTHIYAYLIPATIFLAFGIAFIESTVDYAFRGDYRNVLKYTGIVMVFAFIFIQQYMVFVDNKTEYPWENESFLLWTLPRPTPIFHLSMFGFPYYRNWEGIQDFTKDYPEITAYSTNERKSIVRFYVPLEKSSDAAGFYIHIDDPQSFTQEILNKKPEYWAEKYEPVYTLERNKETLARIYIMPVGSLDDIILQGY